MLEENTKNHWLKIGVVALITFITAFLAFYLVMEIMLKRLNNPFYAARRIEKQIAKQVNDFERFERDFNDSPFVPKMRPMLVNLVKEANEYKVIVDLKPLEGNENNIKVEVEGDELTVKGNLDKKVHGSEKIISFTQTYYLDEKLDQTNITKEKSGDKYIITIPFTAKDNNVLKDDE